MSNKTPKVLIYDFDRGLNSVAPDDRIEEVFGYRPRRFVKSESLQNTFDKLHELYIKEAEDALGLVEEEWYRLREGVDIDFEVLDTITAYQGQKKRDIKKESKRDRISLPEWGIIGDDMEELVMKLTRTESNVIMFGHQKPQEDSDLGIISYVPALSGRMKEEIGRHFDIIAFTVVVTDKKSGQRKYYWQIIADERRSAKCRLAEVSDFAVKNKGLIPQDFGLLWKYINKGGYENVKILILGDSGTGKTYSIRTLKDVVLKKGKEDEGKEAA